MKKALFAVGLLALTGLFPGSALFATTSTAFINARASNQNSEVYNGVQEDISPYGGSVNSVAVNLFCDDFEDSVNYGSSWTANVTAVNSSDLSNTRYGSANLNPSYPSGTTLYEEIAWLFTQTMQPGQSVANEDAIGEAVWLMTGKAGTTPEATATATGTNKTYLQWVSLAQADYNSTVSGFATPDYSQWVIVTDVAAKGNTGGTGKQEFLAYYTANGVPQKVTTLQATPEPSTCVLGGAGLLAAALFGRRKTSKQ